MATTTVNAVLKYWPGGVFGEARQGVYSGSNYSGQMGFDFSAIGDLTNIDISSITLAFHVGALGGAYTKYLYLKQGGRNGTAVGNYSFTGCYNTNKSITFTASNNVAGFNALKAYIEGISGSSVVVLGVNNTYGSRGSASGKSYDYDYMNITSASLALTYTYKKSTGSIGDLTITSANGNNATLKITSYNSSYKHKVTWKLGSWTSTPQSVAAGVSTATQLIIPDRLPNATSGTGTVILETLDSSNNSLGSNTYTFNVKIDDALKPAIGSFTATPVYDSSVTATAQGWGLYIQGKTKATVAMGSVTAGAGATIKSYSITSSPNFGSGTSSSLTSGFLTGTGNVVFTAKVTDSRGRTATKTVTVNVQAYAPPKISAASVIRCTSTGTAAETDGTYAKITATYSCSSIRSGSTEKNSLTATGTTHKCELNGLTNNNISSGTAFVIGAASGSTGALNTDTAYTATITLIDLVGGKTVYTLTVPSAAYILHVKKGGTAVGIGEAASGTNHLGVKWATDFGSWVRSTGGDFYRQYNDADISQANNGLSANAYPRYRVADKNEKDLARLGAWIQTDGRVGVGLSVLNYVNGTYTEKTGLVCYMDKSGNQSYSFGSASAFRNNLGLGNTTGALPIANGGTGQTTAAAARNALGLGNTSGALPVANGGTEATTALAARQNLQAALGKYTTGEVQTGGTWTDGKTIYRYVCSGTTSSTGTIDTGKTLPRTPGNIISISGAVKDNDGIWRALTYASYGNLNQMVSVAVNASNKVMLYIGSAVTGTKTYNITVEYTAT